MKLFWGKLRMFVVLKVAEALCVPIKVREEYLDEHVFGLPPSKTLEEWLAKRVPSVK